MAQTIRPRAKLAVPQAQQPQTPQFGGQPAPPAGTPQANNWTQAPVRSVQSPVVRDQNAMAFLPRAPMSSSTALRSQLGYQTDQYGRQYQMTPQMAGTAMPQGGAGGFVQGQSLGGAPHGIYVQSNLPSPTAGMDMNSKLGFLANRGYVVGRNPTGAIGSMSPDGRFSLYGGKAADAISQSQIDNPEMPIPFQQIASEASARNAAQTVGSQRYQDLKNRRQQMADQRIVARARMRGVGQNTPAVRAAMQRQGMLAQGQGVQGTQPQVAPGAAATVPGQVSARNVQRWSGDPFVVGSLGTDYVSSSPENFRRAFGMVKTPADHQKIAEAWRDRVAMEPELGKKVAEKPALKEEFDAFTGGVDSWGAYSKIAEERRRKQSQDPAQPLPPPRPPVIPPLYNDRGPRSSPYYIPPTSPGSR